MIYATILGTYLGIGLAQVIWCLATDTPQGRAATRLSHVVLIIFLWPFRFLA